MDAEATITAHVAQLRQRGVDLGPSSGPAENIGFGGWREVFQNGHVYHHDSVSTAAVYGGILEAYLALNGPLAAASGERVLGFPRADEADLYGLARISRFEWGSILWRGGAHVLRSPHAERWQSSLDAVARDWHPKPKPIVPTGQAFAQYQPFDLPVLPLVPPLGFPVSSSFIGADRIVTVFERGLMISPRGTDAVAEADVDLPMIGRPAIMQSGSNSILPIYVRCADDANATLISQALGGRVVLVPVGGGPSVPLQFETVPADRRASVTSQLVERDRAQHRTSSRSWLLEAHCPPLADRTLYSVAILGDGNVPQVWAPHAIYAKQAWSNFGFVHATDLHVARRNDRYYEGLVSRGFTEGAKAYQNFNDCFRDMIVAVNRLHAAGLVDVVIATGDLTDFGYDADDVGGNRGGNFRFFRSLIMGWEPSSDPAHRSEALRVPIFLTPGNHDYRRNPYALYFDLNQDFGLFDVDVMERNEFTSFNLVTAEARALQDGRKLDISPDTAAEYLMIDKPLLGYHLELADAASYVVNLGPHRLVMLDSRWDAGRVLDVIGLAGAWVAPSRANLSILGGSPMQVGPTDSDLGLLRRALAEAGEQGLVITGVHAPPFNPWGNHFAHYFRETQPTDAKWEDEIIGHLIRCGSFAFDLPTPTPLVGGASVPMVRFSRDLGKDHHAGWFARGAEGFFFEGNASDNLDYGCIDGNRTELLETCVGKGQPRPIDLLLCGHQHCNVDFRLQLSPAGKLRFFTDFYTQNPNRPEAGEHARDFYGSVMLGDTFKFPTQGIGSQCSAFLQSGARRAVRVKVREQATGTTEITRQTRGLATLEIDPYRDPLATTADARAWWSHHRPLILQTGAVGPVENSQRETADRPADLIQPTFAGVRVGLVRDDVIQKVHFVSREQLRPDRTIPWAAPTIVLAPMNVGTVLHR